MSQSLSHAVVDSRRKRRRKQSFNVADLYITRRECRIQHLSFAHLYFLVAVVAKLQRLHDDYAVDELISKQSTQRVRLVI